MARSSDRPHFPARVPSTRSGDRAHARIAATTHGLPPKLLRAARYILGSDDRIAFMTVRQLAQAAGVAPATIVRLVKGAGYETFDAFRAEIRASVLSAGRSAAHNAAKGAAMPRPGTPAASAASAALQAIGALSTRDFERRIERISDLIVGASAVHVAGYRSAYALAHYMAYLGRTAFAKFRLVSQADASAADHLAHAGRNDLVVIFSFRPYSIEAVRMAEAVRDARIDLVAVTDCAQSPLARDAREYLAIPMPAMGRLQSLTAALAASELILERSFEKIGPKADEEIARFYARVKQMRGYWEP